jgi:hypothetical protein
MVSLKKCILKKIVSSGEATAMWKRNGNVVYNNDKQTKQAKFSYLPLDKGVLRLISKLNGQNKQVDNIK